MHDEDEEAKLHVTVLPITETSLWVLNIQDAKNAVRRFSFISSLALPWMCPFDITIDIEPIYVRD